MKLRLTHIVLILVLISVPWGVFAQMGGGSGKMEMMGKGMMGGGMMEGDAGMHGMMNMHGMGMDAGMMEMMKMMGAASRLELTPEQKKKFEMMKLSHQKEAIPLMGEIQMAGVEIRELLLNDPVDMAKIKDKIKAKHDAMAKLEAGHLGLKQQLKSILTSEQRLKMESMMMEMMDMGSMMGGSAKGSEETSRETPQAPSGSPSKSTDPHGH